MENGTEVTEYADVCPEHDNPIRHSYTFGMNDAELVTFTGCNCAVVFPLTGWGDPGLYYDNYASASGKAKMLARMAAVW